MGGRLEVPIRYQSDDCASDAYPVFDYTYDAPAVFAQIERDFGARTTLTASARWDDHSEYGAEISPRVSLAYRPGDLTLRASFGSDIDDAVRLETVTADRVRRVNSEGASRTRGSEPLLRWRQDPFVVTGSYLYLDSSEPDDTGTGRRDVPLTPRHSAGIVAMWEEHDRGRIGLEVYYTGEQPLEDNPYRNEGKSYFEIGLLGEIVLGHYRLFLNLENILDVRRTREDPLVRPVRAPDGSWTVDAWAPLEGFVVNGGIRIRFGE